MLANASSCLELRFARVSPQEEPLAPRSGENNAFCIFLGVLAHFSCVRASAWGVWRGAWASGVGRGSICLGELLATDRSDQTKVFGIFLIVWFM